MSVLVFALLSSSTKISEPSTSYSEGYGDCFVVCTRCHPSMRSESERKEYKESTAKWSMKCTRSSDVCNLDWSVWRDQFSSTTTPGYMPHNQPCWSWTNWTTRLCFFNHTHPTSRPPTTIFSSIYKTSSAINASKMKMIPTTPSMLSWHPERKTPTRAA